MAKTITLSQPLVAARSCSVRLSKLCFQLTSSTAQWTSGDRRIFARLAAQDASTNSSEKWSGYQSRFVWMSTSITVFPYVPLHPQRGEGRKSQGVGSRVRV